MNKHIRTFLGPQSLDALIKPITAKVDELAAFANANRLLAIEKRKQAEALQAEAELLQYDAERAEEIGRKIKGLL